jgi:MAE_28990/MAE_18760-like HEPN
MSKPYSDTDFSAQITEDRSWRLKEISDLKTAVVKADVKLRRVLLRALITICYAHWEGYVRFSARKYLEHVALRKYRYKDLDRQFLRNYFLPRLAALSINKTSIAERCALVDEVLNASERRFSHMNEDLVNTKANLNSDVLTDICLVCTVPAKTFAGKATFIDKFLLKRRNAVAHGEDTFVEMEDLDELTTGTVELMRAFGDAVENQVVLKDYKSAVTVAQPPNSP